MRVKEGKLKTSVIRSSKISRAIVWFWVAEAPDMNLNVEALRTRSQAKFSISVNAVALIHFILNHWRSQWSRNETFSSYVKSLHSILPPPRVTTKRPIEEGHSTSSTSSKAYHGSYDNNPPGKLLWANFTHSQFYREIESPSWKQYDKFDL